MEVPRRTTVVLAAITALIVTTAPSVHATNDLGFRMPDGTPTYMLRNDLTTGFSDAVEWHRQNNMNPTDLTTLYTTSIYETYMNIVDSNYGAIGWSGAYNCASWASGSICQRGDVYLNLYGGYVPGGSYDATERRSLVCEEIGHAVGLDHRKTVTVGCLTQDWSRTSWTDHDNNHVNNWY